MKKLSLITIIIATSILSFAAEYEKIYLDTISTQPTIPDSILKEYPAIILKDKLLIEYAYEKNELVMYQNVHRQTYVIDDKGIEHFNRVYIPFSRSMELIDLKARSIAASGTITNLDTSNIKEIQNLDDNGAYRIFAIEGVQKGSTVEILYTLRNVITAYGKYTFQQDIPVLEASFSLVTPSNLNFDVKGYNSIFKESDTIINKLRYINRDIQNLPALRKEKYSAYQSNLARVEYNFSFNSSIGSKATNTWNDIAKSLNEAFYQIDPKSEKTIVKLVKKLSIDKKDELDKVKTIENFLKDNYQIKEYNIPGIETIDNALKNKYTNEEGFTRLFCNFLKIAGINHQLGSTTNRFDSRFDKDFVTWHYLYEYIIYFPGLEKYLSPTAAQFRIGILPDGLVNNQALFLKTVTMDNFTSILPDIKTIPANKCTENFTNQIAQVTIDENRNLASIHYRHELGGYEDNYIHPYYDYIPQEQRQGVIEEMLKIMGKDTKVMNFKVENTDHNVSTLEKPFIVDGNIEVQSLIEKAGDQIIFSIGKVIGEQVEMYDEHTRQNPIELEFAHQYNRTIEVNIPPGFTVKGEESLTMDKEYGNGAIGFVSKYELTNDKLLVNVNEYYRDVFLPTNMYADFRTVINAAADFNKISIVFEKMK